MSSLGSSTPAVTGRPLSDVSVVPSIKGLPWWAAVLVALAGTTLGAVIDISRTNSNLDSGTLGTIFSICTIFACVLAVLVVRRRGVFTTMVQPPLVIVPGLAIAVIASGKGTVIGAASVFVSTFPTMAIATGAAVAIGLIRWFTQKETAPVSSPARVDGPPHF